MAGSLNMVCLIGHLGADPEIRSMQSGSKVCNLRLATSENWKDKTTGERKEHTEWHRIVIFSEGIIGVCDKYLKKGSKIYIQGQLKTRKWTDQSGKEKFSTEVVIQGFNGVLTMLDKAGGSSSSSGEDHGSKPAPAGRGDMDDEIPF